MNLDVDKTAKTVTISNASAVELALLRVGSERSAVDTARRLYGLDRDTAKLLVRAAREGEEVETDG